MILYIISNTKFLKAYHIYTCSSINREFINFYPFLSSVPVVITNPMINLTVIVGNQAFLPCEVYGDPAPNVTWYKGRKETCNLLCVPYFNSLKYL